MRNKAFVYFWASTAASVLLLGSIWSLAGRIEDVGFSPVDVTLLIVASLGLGATFFVAARIAFVVGRTKKGHRTRRLHGELTR